MDVQVSALGWGAGLIVLPLAGALLAFVVRPIATGIGMTAAVTTVVACAGLVHALVGTGAARYPIGGWDAPLGIVLTADGLPTLRETLDEVVERGQRYDVYVSFRPPAGVRGLLSFKLYLGCRRGVEEHWYMARFTHQVHPGIAGENIAQPSSKDGVIIGNDHPDGAGDSTRDVCAVGAHHI